MTKHDWDTLFDKAKDHASHCTSKVELAEHLGVPISTLKAAMKRRGVTFASLLMGVSEDRQAVTEKMRLQMSYMRKEVEHLQKQIGRREWFVEAVSEAAAMLKPALVTPPSKSAKPDQEQVGMLLVSDVHLGQNTPAEQVGLFGEYNSDIAIARVKHVFTKFASVVKHQPFPVDEVVVMFLGDNVEHAHLRPGHEGFVDMNVIKQSLTFSNVAGHGLAMLAGQFKRVRAIGVSGNHGRVTADPRKSDPTENFDYLCYHIMKRMLDGQSNIEWSIPESWYALFRVAEFNFFAIHGEGIRSYVGYPWYGASKRARQYVAMFRLAQRRKIREENPQTAEEWRDCMIVPDYVLLAHFHTNASWEAPDIEHFANGAMPGVSKYGAKDRAVISRPSQKILFVHPRYGVGIRCPIDLDEVG